VVVCLISIRDVLDSKLGYPLLRLLCLSRLLLVSSGKCSMQYLKHTTSNRHRLTDVLKLMSLSNLTTTESPLNPYHGKGEKKKRISVNAI
jgi:hypothetical protein